MKKTFYLAIIALWASTSFAQNGSIGLNLPSLLMANASLVAEIPVNDNLTANLGLSLRPPLRFMVQERSVFFNLKGFSAMPEIRYYVRGQAQSGVFFGPYLKYNKLSTGQAYVGMDYWSGLTDKLYSGFYLTELGAGINLGARIIRDKFSVDVFVGPRYAKYEIEIRYYHFPNETVSEDTYTLEELYGWDFPRAGEVKYETTLYYDKVTFPVKIPNVRLGFVVNYSFNLDWKKPVKIEKTNPGPEIYNDDEY